MRPVILVTGAARRLGRHIACHLAGRGFDVAAHHRSAPDPDIDSLLTELKGLGASAVAVQADLAHEAAVRALVPAVLAQMGRLDAIVNSAALFEHDAADTLSFGSLQAHWQPNTAAPLLLAQALHAHCKTQQRQGCVVNLLDQKLWNPNPDHLSYTLSKAALQAATPLLAQAFAPVLRVVGVAPGLTLGSPDIDAAKLATLQAQTPLGYGVTPDDVADAVLFALQCKSLTGSHLLIDAGSHLSRSPRDFAFL
jgi:NAD(P)-dependent dehydrogenase (short-subunit alcohol dehydrogenase family)